MTDGRPTGTVTFLFTDIEGSMELWEAEPERMRVALARHDAIVRSAIEDGHGYVFSTAGDAFSAAFEGAGAAVTVAAEMQSSLAAELWPMGVALQVRIGLHTGVADERAGDYFGPTPSRCARLMSAGHGGQVLMSGSTAELVRGSFKVRGLGAYLLKGVPESIPLYELVADSPTSSFPPLRALPESRTNLPARRDRFVGRVADLERVVEQLGEHRHVTLTAAGGTGKSRLAIEAATEMSAEFPDGVWLVELAGVESSEEIAAHVGRAIGFNLREGSDWLTTAAEWLSVKEILVVLDNCDHVIDDAARTVAAVLDRGERVRILATSREPLGVRGEVVTSLTPLDPATEGTQLFVDRASAADDRFDASGSKREIEELCHRLDGLPLAIELAAARVRTLQPAEMLELLDHRFEWLRSRDRMSDQRHRTVRATIEWSYELLSDSAQQLFDRLSVFRGNFDVDAASAIGAPTLERFVVIDLLDELEAKSLLESRVIKGRSRYRLLETLAAFGREQLMVRGDHEAVMALHSEHFIDSTITLIDDLVGLEADDAAALVPLVMEQLAETRRALYWALEHDPDRALDAAITLATFLMSVRAVRQIATLIELLDELAQTDPSGRASALAALGCIADSDVERMTARARATLDAGVDPAARALALVILARTDLVVRNENDGGIVHLEQALGELAVTDDKVWTALVASFLAAMFGHAGKHERSRLVFEELVEPNHHSLPRIDMFSIEAVANAYRFADRERSTNHLRRTIELAETADLVDAAGMARYQLAVNHMMARDNRAAFDELVTCLPGLLAEGEALAAGFALEDLAAVLAREGRLDEALVCLAAAVADVQRRTAVGPRVYVRRRDKIRTQGEHELGKNRTADAWQRGSNMTLDAAVAWAIELNWP
jgi:predicted ATPase/class 3 adenylate cyclase